VADRRAPLTEQVLRETKDDLVRRITDQKRMGGVSSEPGLERDVTGGQRESEIWLEPILRKVEQDHERERDRDVLRPSEPVQEARHVDTKDELGTYDWNLKTDKIVARPGSWQAKTHAQDQVRLFVRGLFKVPEWRDRLMSVAKLCGTHYAPDPSCAPCHRREDAQRRLIAVAMAHFKKKAPKITVGG
jgi:hypothetical protein